MPTYEVEMNGKSFEVDAPSIDAFMSAYQGSAGGQAAPKETLLEHIGKWPGRIADTVRGAVTLPRDVLPSDSALRFGESGRQVDPFSGEGFERAQDLASMIVPGSVAAGTGGMVRRATDARRGLRAGEANPEFRAPTPNMEAAQTAADLGAPLPAGVVSENKGTQALTQAARQLPLVGGEIDKRISGTVDAAGNAVKNIAETLSGGVPDRATAGANLRPSLQGVIDNNNATIDSVYGHLRHVIDPDAVSHVQNTAAALKGIMGERVAARMAKPEAGLQDIIKLANNGASFNGLQRARADVGKIIGLAESNPNPGFNVGDFKRLYAAMSGDMENTVRANARPGAATPDQAVSVLRAANGAADQLIERNKNVQKLLNVQSDERLVGGVINSAQDKTGNVRVLAQLRSQMPKQDFEQITGVALSEMGHNPATGEFSLNKFSTGWDKLGDTAKSVMFSDPAHRKALDDIASLGKTLKNSDQYRNTSNTGRVAALTGALGAVGGAAASANVAGVIGALAGMGGGYGLAKYLARPATASALAKWAKAAQNAPRVPSAATMSMVGLTTRNLISNLSDIPGFSKDEFLHRLQGPVHADTRDEQSKPGVANVKQKPAQRQRNYKDQSVAPSRNGPISP